MKIVVHQRSKSDVAKSKGKTSKAKLANETETDTIKLVDLPKGWIEKILSLDCQDLAKFITTLASKGDIPLSQLKQGLPSFLAAKWDNLAPSLGLPDLALANFESYGINPVLLPPLFHEATTKAAWRIQDVYQKWLAQDREDISKPCFFLQ